MAEFFQEHVAKLARAIAGDDEQRFLVVFHALANQAETFAAGDVHENYRQARSVLRRANTPPTRSAVGAVGDLPPDGLYSDMVYLANARKLVKDRSRIIGGVPTSDFPECVAVGSPDQWCCSGTLVAPNVVVTAAHCVKGGCCARVFLGEDVAFEQDGTVVEVTKAVSHPSYGQTEANGDIAVLILASPADVEPRAIASAADVTSATFARLAGYGNTDVFSRGGYGRRRLVDAPMASNDPKYGCDTATEFVAGAPFLDKDSCNGDSGGPAYVSSGDKWLLAGATSRATASSLRPCGDGGIYTSVCAYEDWIRSVPGGEWS
ncbi:MAG: serine protease [Kibdelosporangium sp.]